MRVKVEVLGRVLCILILSAIFFIACKDKSPDGKAQPINPYGIDTVYEEIKEKLSKEPDNPDLWYHLADLYERNGAYAQEIDALKKVLQLKPDMGYAYFKMGTAYSRLNMPDEAIGAFKKALRFMPQNPVLYNNLAIAYGKKGLIDEEIKALEKAVSLRPGYATARFNLGKAYLKVGNKKAAIEQYRRLSQIDQGMAELLLKEMEVKK